MRLIIPGSLPGLNEIINASKSNWSVYRKMKQEHTELVAWLAKRLPEINRADITITWYCPNKRKDKDNIMAGQKFLFDGLQKAGVIKNDGWKQIGDITHQFRIDKKNPRVELEFKVISS